MPVNNKIISELDEYCERNSISEEKRKKIEEAIRHLYSMSYYDPEEAVGVVTAQSLSEPATQMTMRTYHFAGTAGIQVTLGLPRLLEIFDARKEPRTPTMTVYLERKPEVQTLANAKRIAESIKEVRVKDITISTTMDLADLIIRCKLNKEKLERMGLEIDKMKKIVKVRNAEISVDGDCLVLKPKKKDITTIHKLRYNLLETHVGGIKDITQVVVTKENDEWVITTLGSSLKRVFDIEGVDYTRTKSNNIFEVYDVLGVEAARCIIMEQARFTMVEQGLGVDIRYIMLLADLMTMDGKIKPIGRYGISGQKMSVLVRASFEETKKHLTSASIRGEKDMMRGTIENIMVNQVAPIGTGSFELIGRIPSLEKPQPIADKSEKPEKAAKTEKPEKKPRAKTGEKPKKKVKK